VYALSDYDYQLPEGLIAQRPMARRDRSRLMCLDRPSGRCSHRHFRDMIDLLNPGDLLVLNNTRVIPGRLLGRKESGGKVEALILDYAQGIRQGVFECMIKASKRPRPGTRLIFEQGLEARVESVNAGTCNLSFNGPDGLDQALDAIGHVPLPPYIQRSDDADDRGTYQTVYAEHKGAIAAPTAGLHFTREMLDCLTKKGVDTAYVTLHVGYGTFVPVRVDDIRHHEMHAEWFSLDADAASTINVTRKKGGKAVAVGTTCVRTLEYCASPDGTVHPQTGLCDLFIYPGYTFKAVDAMITNFHLPQSTLLMLVSAFAGREKVLRAYDEAVREGYRFFSYGDAMYIYTENLMP
jgi:S-adenosylmethionine:tRNA ribosyltransferase-isomerase